MNGQTVLVPTELIVEVSPGDPDWSAHFLGGFEQWPQIAVAARLCIQRSRQMNLVAPVCFAPELVPKVLN
jgi:hypothetical protein